MTDLMPWRGSTAAPDTRRAAVAQSRTELEIFTHHLQARFQAECDRIDSAAIADVTKAAIEEEVAVLDYGLDLAQGSAAKIELVSRLVGVQSRIDTARISRRFGG